MEGGTGKKAGVGVGAERKRQMCKCAGQRGHSHPSPTTGLKWLCHCISRGTTTTQGDRVEYSDLVLHVPVCLTGVHARMCVHVCAHAHASVCDF